MGYDFRARVDRRLFLVNFVFLALLRAVTQLRSMGVPVRFRRCNPVDHSIELFEVVAGSLVWVIVVYVSTARVWTPRDVARVSERIRQVLVKGVRGVGGGVCNPGGILYAADVTRIYILDGTRLTSGAYSMIASGHLDGLVDRSGGRRSVATILRYLWARLQGLAKKGTWRLWGDAKILAVALAVIILAYARMHGEEAGLGPPPPEVEVSLVDYAAGADKHGLDRIVDILGMYANAIAAHMLSTVGDANA